MYIAIIYVVIMNLKESFNVVDRPRERLFQFGATALSDYELVSIILGFGGKNHSVTEISKRLLKTYGGLKGMSQVTSSELLLNKYIGKSKAASIIAMNEIALRIMTQDLQDKRPKISTPKDVYDCLRRALFMKKRECLYLLSLDSHNVLIEKDLISVGTIHETLVSPREIFRQALLRNAVTIILAHNHPSNKAVPSNADLTLTEQVAQVGQKLGIKMLDHVIICDHDYCSIKAMDVFIVNEKGGEKNDTTTKT